MAALQYVDVPGYAAILFRRTYQDLALPGALMDRAHMWLDGTDAHWSDKKKTWVFPSGATISFGYLQHENDKYRYQGAEFQGIFFDELTQFEESQYRYLFSRLRRLKGSKVPIRIRSASNPGGLGHDWVLQRMIREGQSKGRIFVPATLRDNPHLDEEDYLQSLAELDPITRQQLLDGDWNVRTDGKKFKRHWFKIVDGAPSQGRVVRYWDLAATEPAPGKDPAYTAGVKVLEQDGQYWIMDVVRTQATPKNVENLIHQTAMIDGKGVEIWMEQEPGSSGVNTIDHYRRQVLKGFAFYADKVTGNKELRANPLSSAAEAGNVFLISGDWNGDFLDEAAGFPYGKKDQVDAASAAYSKLHEIKDQRFAVKPTIAGFKRR